MNKQQLTKLLESFKSGDTELDTIANVLLSDAAQKLQHATIDTERAARTGQPETVFGESKTPEQIVPIVQVLNDHQQAALVTRIDSIKGELLQKHFPDGEWNVLGRTFLLNPPPIHNEGDVALICAGTSDLYVAEEADTTLRAMGIQATRYTDIGVAGLHRLLSQIEAIRQHKVLIVIAGMEGALATVLAGLVKTPIIGVPTAVGYGCHLNGLTPLLGMLNSCAPGVVVCNIDNGYGAAIAAVRIVSTIHER